jgi:hypothetical protein
LDRSKGAQFFLRRGTARAEHHLEPRRGLPFGISFYPDALSAMTKLDLSSFSGRVVPAEDPCPSRSNMGFRRQLIAGRSRAGNATAGGSQHHERNSHRTVCSESVSTLRKSVP